MNPNRIISIGIGMIISVDPYTRCMCCSSMENNIAEYKSTKTARKYKLRDITPAKHYSVCTWSPVVYALQMTRSMRDSHYGHRSEIKRCEEGCGAIFPTCSGAEHKSSDQHGGTHVLQTVHHYHCVTRHALLQGQTWQPGVRHDGEVDDHGKLWGD